MECHFQRAISQAMVTVIVQIMLNTGEFKYE
jgi:hypothetical protein